MQNPIKTKQYTFNKALVKKETLDEVAKISYSLADKKNEEVLCHDFLYTDTAKQCLYTSPSHSVVRRYDGYLVSLLFKDAFTEDKVKLLNKMFIDVKDKSLTAWINIPIVKGMYKAIATLIKLPNTTSSKTEYKQAAERFYSAVTKFYNMGYLHGKLSSNSILYNQNTQEFVLVGLHNSRLNSADKGSVAFIATVQHDLQLIREILEKKFLG